MLSLSDYISELSNYEKQIFCDKSIAIYLSNIQFDYDSICFNILNSAINHMTINSDQTSIIKGKLAESLYDKFSFPIIDYLKQFDCTVTIFSDFSKVYIHKFDLTIVDVTYGSISKLSLDKIRNNAFIFTDTLRRAEVSPYIMEKYLYLGYTRNKEMSEKRGTNKRFDCLTTYRQAQEELDASIKITGYKAEEGYDVDYNIQMSDMTYPIIVKYKNKIPDDYNGWMLCSHGVLQDISYKEFDFRYIDSSLNKWYDTDGKNYKNFTILNNASYTCKCLIKRNLKSFTV